MFTKNIHSRIKIIMFVVIFLFILIIFKVFYIQVIDYKDLYKKANDLWSRNLPIEGDRGLIYDRTGVLLAGNETRASLIAIPNQIKDIDDTSLKIANILNVDKEEIKRHLTKKISIERIHPEGRRLTYDIATKITDLNLPGIYLMRESKRYYPYDRMLSSSIGFVGVDNQGLSGLELTYDKYLTGSYGALKYFSDAKGNNLKLNDIYVKPSSGMNIYLTIDYSIQSALERELSNAMSRYEADGAWGIVMDPNTSEILAVASYPNFSPSNYQDYSIEQINRNLPVWMTYEPGSTFKIITLAASLEEGIVDLYNDHFYDSGSIKVGGATIHCWKHGGHGYQTYLEVVQNSCNPGFVSLGLKLGKEKLFSYIKNFGFGQKTGVDLSGEGSGILFNVDKIGDLELATTSFGQGVSVTPIQQITAVSAAINGGFLNKPYIVKNITEPVTNSVIFKNEKEFVRRVISEDTSSKVRDALESVVYSGTGRNAYIDGFRVGGKTGTAQKQKDGTYLVGDYIVSFMGFLPADNPKVIAYIAVDHAKGITQYGGTIAAPIARNVLLTAIDALDISPSGGKELEYTYLDKKYYTVPDVVNMELKEGLKLLKNFKVEYSGEGSTIKYQTPSAYERIKESDTIRLLLGE